MEKVRKKSAFEQWGFAAAAVVMQFTVAAAAAKVKARSVAVGGTGWVGRGRGLNTEGRLGGRTKGRRDLAG